MIEGIKVFLKKTPNFLRKTSIKNRLIASISVGIIFCSSILGGILYLKATTALKNSAIEYSETMLSIITKDIYRNKKRIENYSSEMAMNEEIIDTLMNYKFLSYKEKDEFHIYINKYLLSNLSLLSNIAEIEIVSKDFDIAYMQGYKYFNIKDLKKYSKQAKEGLSWFYTVLNGEKYICVVTPVKGEDSLVGYIFMAIKDEFFSSSFSLFNLDEGEEMVLLDDKHNLIISDNPLIDKKFVSENIELKSSLKNKREEGIINSVILEEKKYVAIYKKLRGLSWYVVSMIPYDFINSDIHSLRKEMILIGVIFILVILIFSYFLYSSIKVPLYNLLDKMKTVSKGDLKVLVNDEYKDEIGIISNNFDSMLFRINELIEKSKQQEIEKRDLEIRMLQAQINPHFLFNTLNSLKWTALMNQDYTVSEGLSSLAELLRNTIIDKNELITIKKEVENIKNYVVIQKIRYGNSFEVKYDIEEDLLENKIIKFILQPIVENSIIHGIDENKENQWINIKITSEKENILIIIEDNGKGFNSGKNIKNNKLSGIGWNNVDERIKLTFGLEYGALIESEINRGTVVKIVIPKNYKE